MSQYRYVRFDRQPKGLLSQIVAVVVGAAILVVSFVFGAFLLASFFGLVLIVAAVVLVRGWWLRRKMSGVAGEEFRAFDHRQSMSESSTNTCNGAIDAEYTVVDSDKRQGS